MSEFSASAESVLGLNASSTLSIFSCFLVSASSFSIARFHLTLEMIGCDSKTRRGSGSVQNWSRQPTYGRILPRRESIRVTENDGKSLSHRALLELFTAVRHFDTAMECITHFRTTCHRSIFDFPILKSPRLTT